MAAIDCWRPYPKSKPLELGWYLCHNGYDAYWLNQWMGKRWKYHSSEMEWWTHLPPAPVEERQSC